MLFAVGMLDHASFEQSEAKRESPQQSDAEPLLIDRSNGVELSQPQTSHVDLDVSLDAPRSADHDRSDAGSSRSDKGGEPMLLPLLLLFGDSNDEMSTSSCCLPRVSADTSTRM